MKRIIKYYEPYFDPYTHEYDHEKGQYYEVTAKNENEFTAIMMSISNPEREIPQDSITITEIEEELGNDNPNTAQSNSNDIMQLRADVDYLLIMGGMA